MCTVSWVRHVDGYELFANRDERKTRRSALPPVVHRAAARAFLAPIDADAGGTWISVNAAGLALCLLNDYEAPEPAVEAPTSRGLVVRELADARDVEEALERLAARPLGAVRGFALLALGLGATDLAIGRWDTRELSVSRTPPVRPLLVSSGWNAAAVRASRAATFDELVGAAPAPAPAAERHALLHAAHLPERGPLSPCMHRDDAHTVSASRVRVTRAGARFEYRPGAPCEGLPARVERLAADGSA